MLALLVLLSLSPDQVNPPVSGHYARDVTGRVSTDTLAGLDAIAREVKASGNGELGIAVVGSTHGMPPRVFATQLFNHWGIGNPARNDGMLLFVALDDHKAEIIIGKGLLNVRISESQTDGVMAQVVQRFKAHDVDGALLTGARGIARLLKPEGSTASATDTPTSSEVQDALDGKFTDPSPRSWVIDLTGTGTHSFPELNRAGDGAYAQGQRRLFFVVTTDARLDSIATAVQQKLGSNAVVVAFDPNGLGASAVGPRIDHGNKAYARTIEQFTTAVRSSDWSQAQIDASTYIDMSLHGMPRRSADEAVEDVMHGCGSSVFAWPVLGLLGGIFGFRRWNRYRPRTCECGRPRQRLGAYAEKKFLTPSQEQEEELGSVDYDVWWCAICKDVWINDNVAWFSRYSRCPSCQARTRTSSTTTISYATEYSSGLEEITESCQGCGYNNVYTRTTAMLTRSSSTWDSSSSSDSGGSSSSSDSFSGGSSDGGGSSGSW